MLKRYGHYIALLVILLLHLPFLQADPDGLLAWHSRGAWTDEGLYTAQARNLIHSGHLGITQMDGFAKTPFFTAYILPFLYLLGTHLWVARLAVLLFSLVATYQLIKRCFAGVAAHFAWATIGLQYLVFTYSHFAMAEMLGASCIVWAAVWYVKYTDTLLANYALYAAVAALLAFGCKTSYLFGIAIVPTCIGIVLLRNLLVRNKAVAIKHARALLYTIVLNILFLLLFYTALYLPNKALYDKILAQDVAVKFVGDIAILVDTLVFNLEQIAGETALLSYLLLAAIISLTVLFIKVKNKLPGNALIQFCSVWLLLELPKLTIPYLPSRYLVSMFLCLAIILAAHCYYLYKYQYKGLAIAAVSIGILCNIFFYVQSLMGRTYQVQTINAYLQKTATGKRVMLGTWAPTACWESGNITMPVWETYNDDNFMQHHPQAIITEVDERDAGYIFSKRGVNLKEQSDSVRVFTIAEWQVAVHWMK